MPDVERARGRGGAGGAICAAGVMALIASSTICSSWCTVKHQFWADDGYQFWRRAARSSSTARAPRPLRAQLEDGLREAVRDGRLAARSRLPATRALAADLGVSRRLVVDSYAQLLAEGYLTARRGSGHVRGGRRASAGAAPAARPPRARSRYDFFPGNPDLAGFPAAGLAAGACGRSCARRPTAPSGTPIRAARSSCGARWPGICGACAASSRTSIGRRLLGRRAGASRCWRARSGRPRMAVEDPGLPLHRADPRRQRRVAAAAARGRARRAASRSWRRSAASGAPPAAVLVTPAHQSPTGVALSPAAPRASCSPGPPSARAGRRGRLRRRVPLRPPAAGGAAGPGPRPRGVHGHGQQDARAGAAPRLAGAARAAGRRRHRAEAARRRRLAHDRAARAGPPDRVRRLRPPPAPGPPPLPRPPRRARGRGRAPPARAPRDRRGGRAARDRAPARAPSTGSRWCGPRARRSVGVYPLGYAYIEPRPSGDGLVLGYANLAEPAIEEGIRLLALALADLPRRRRPTNDGGAIAEVVRERPARQAAALEGPHDGRRGAAGRDLADRPLHGQQPAEFARVGVGEGARSARAPARGVRRPSSTARSSRPQASPKYSAVRMPSAVSGRQCPAESPTKKTPSSTARRSWWGIQLPW